MDVIRRTSESHGTVTLLILQAETYEEERILTSIESGIRRGVDFNIEGETTFKFNPGDIQEGEDGEL